MKTVYALRVRLNEFLSQGIHYYSDKVNRTMQDITTDAIHEYLKSRLSFEEYQNLLKFSQRKDKLFDQMDKQINEDWFEYYDKLSDERKKLLDDVYQKCLDKYEKDKTMSLNFFEEVPGYNELKENEQDRLRISFIQETSDNKNEDPEIDLERFAKAFDDHKKRMKEHPEEAKKKKGSITKTKEKNVKKKKK